MNYQRIYDQFIADRRNKQSAVIASGVYTEVHHKLPRSLGGDDSPENLVTLTFRDHVHAHILLGRIHGGKQWLPAFLMVNAIKGKNRVRITRPLIVAAEMARIKYSEVASDVQRQLRIDHPEIYEALYEKLRKFYDGNKEIRERISESLRIARMNDPGIVKRISAGVKKAYAENPDIKIKQSDANKRKWQNPDFREKSIAARKEAANRPEVKAKHSANSKAKWADPEWAARQISKYVAAQGKPEARKRNAEQASKMHQRQGFKELHRDATKAALTPEVCEARGKALSASIMSCPQKRAAKAEAARIGNRYRREASKYFGVSYRQVTSEMVAQWKQETLSTGDCGSREARTASFAG